MEPHLRKPDSSSRLDDAKPLRPLMQPHYMTRSLPKQSHIPTGKEYHFDCPYRSAVCLQEGLQQCAYYSPRPDTKDDYHRKLSLSSFFKPKCAEKQFKEEYAAEQQQEMAADFHKEAESRKKQWAMGGGFPGNQHWIYDERQQGQQYAVPVLQESGRNYAFREAGDTGTVISSGDSSLKTITVRADLSNMSVNVRDAMTGGDTPLPPSITGVFTVETDTVLNDEAQKEVSASSSSAASAGSSDSESESEVESEHKFRSEPESKTALNVTYTIEPYDEAASHTFLPEVHSQCQQPHEQESRTFQQQPLPQNQRHSIPIPPEYANPHEANQRYVRQYYTGQAYRQSYQPAQQMNYQQEHTNPQMDQDEKDAYAPRNVGNKDVPLRMPGEGASLRSFQSQSGAEIGFGETGEDSRSLQSRTNMGAPLLRSTLSNRGTESDKSRKSYLLLAFNVIVFSVLAGVVAAFIVQQVVNG